MIPNAQTGCLRCGTCCKKGGPAIHLQDMAIIRKGVLGPQHIVSLRTGEMAYNNVAGIVAPLAMEIIKIKARTGSSACVFFDETVNGCAIYEDRPKECIALACWDTTKIEAMYSKDRLTRFDLVPPKDAVRKFITAHEERCSAQALARLVDELGSKTGDQAVEAIIDMLAYDERMRPMLVQKANLDPGHLDFLFGRPMNEVVRGFGLEVKKQAGRFILVPA